MNKFLKILFFSFTFFVIFGEAVSAATIYVDSSTGNDTTGDGSSGTPYKTFHKAYTMSSDNDTVDLTGTFTWTDADETGDSSYNGYTIEKDLIINGNGIDQTIIQSASSSTTGNRRIFTISSTASSTIQNLTLRYGRITSTSYYGGAVFNDDGALLIDNCEIYDNRAGGGGGGVASEGTTTIQNSAIYNNTVSYMGGGVLNSYYATGELSIINSTIYSNQATATSGYYGSGGVHIRGETDTYITNSTIVENTSYGGGGGVDIDSKGSLATLTVKNTIIADNTCTNYSSLDDFDHDYGSVVDNGYNIVGVSSGFTWSTNWTWTDTNDDGTFILNSTSTTGTLNLDTDGGVNDDPDRIKTYAILSSGSIAVDGGSTVANGSVSVPSVDQRGATRNGATDIGAFEYDGGGLSISDPSTQASEVAYSSVEYNQMTISWTNGSGSRRAVFMKQANTGTASPVDNTTYTTNAVFGSGTQIGSSGWYAIYNGLSTSVTVTGLVKATDYIVQVFEYNGVTPGDEDYLTDTASNNPSTESTYTPVTIYINSSTGNDSTGDGSSGSPYKTFHKAYTEANGDDTISATGTFTWTDADESGDLQYYGYKILKDLTITGGGPDQTIFQAASSENSTDRRVFTIDSNASSTISHMTIRYGDTDSYSSQYGGGVSNVSGNLKVEHCEIYSNRSQGGGGVSSDGTTEILNSAIYNNTVSYMGGGVLNEYYAVGDLSITNCSIYGNTVTRTTAYFSGGGFHHRSNTNTYITNTTVYDNYSRWGGGIDLDSRTSGQGHVYLKNTIVAGNDAHYSSTKDVYMHSPYGTYHDNGNNIIGISTYSWAADWNWLDGDGDGTFILNSTSTTGTLNLDSVAAINSNPHKTKTYALLEDSIAINGGSSNVNELVVIPTTDQRTASRSSTVDIGAFEYGGEFAVPVVLSLSPSDGVTNVTSTANLVITFDEAVDAESGNVTIYESSDDSIFETIDVTSGQVNGSGTAEITINPNGTLEDSTGYYVKIDSTAFDDVDSNSYAGISDTTTWNFTIGDYTDPTVSILSPVDNATLVSVSANLVITFNESVDAESGNITIYKTSDDSIVETFDVTSDISGSGTTEITVNPTSDFNGETEYYVFIDTTAFDDSSSNSYVGINASSTWSFITADISDPTVSILSPVDNATLVSVSANLVITFNESVDAESGNITIYKTSDDSTVETFDVTSDISGSGTTEITINPTADFNGETEYYVFIDTTAFDDSSSNSYAGINASSTWSFMTGDIIIPTISAGSPSGEQLSGTTGVTMSVTTSEVATCKYSTSSGTTYASMIAFIATGSTSHSTSISGLSDGGSYNYYILCQDSSSNESSEYTVSFSVAQAGGGGALAPAPAVGMGGSSTFVPMGQEGAVGKIGSEGINTLSYINSKINFITQSSANDIDEIYKIEIKDLHLFYNTLKAKIDSVDEVIELKLGGKKLIDLDGDDIFDIEVTFADLVVNRVELTIISLNEEGENNKPEVQSKSNYNNPEVETIPETSTPPKTNFNRDLYSGLSGQDVKSLQIFLNNNGFKVSSEGAGSPGNETEYFGLLTQQALTEFQKANNIFPAVGYFGQITMGRIQNSKIVDVPEVETIPETSTPPKTNFNRDLYSGLSGQDVKSLQIFLNNNGFKVSSEGAGSPGNETEYFGPATKGALIEFQKANDISPAKGYFGQITMGYIK
jgi:methionine-rich copper-binding protein CopC